MKLEKWMIDNIQHFNNTVISNKEDPQDIIESFGKLNIKVGAERKTRKISISYSPHPIIINYIFVFVLC